MAVSGRTPPRELAETLAAYERGEINVLINAQLLAEGWNSPRATVCMHLAPTASKRVYQQRIGRIMRTHPRKEAGIVVDFVPKGATHSERVVSLHSLLDSDFYREGARVTPAPRRRSARRARRRLSPAPWLVPVTQDVARRLAVIQREWQRVDPRFLDDDEQRFWATIAGRQIRFDQRAEFARKFAEGRAGKGALETFLAVCAAENPNRRLRMTALADRVATPVERADFDDLVTLVTQAPPWEKDRAAGVRILLRADRRGKGERARPDPRPLDVAARALRPQDARPEGEPGVPGGEAAARRRRELARPPPRGERRPARQDRRGAAAAGRRRPPRLGGGLHASGERPPRQGARGAGPDPGDRDRARREPPGAEGARAEVTPPPPQAAPRRGRAATEATADGGQRMSPGRMRPRSRRRQPSGGVRAGVGRRLRPSPARRLASASASSSRRRCSRSRRNRVSSAASDSPLGSSPPSANDSIESARCSSSSTYACVSASDATASLTWAAYSASASSSSVTSIGTPSSSPRRSQSALAARGLGASET